MVIINRSGAIVLPFLAVYASEVLKFSLTETGLILSIYGLGSVSASLLGGWLTDRFGLLVYSFSASSSEASCIFCFMMYSSLNTLQQGCFY